MPDIQRKFGRIVVLDQRDFLPENLMGTALKAATTAKVLVIPKTRYWEPGRVLDQGEKPDCVAYAATAWEMGAQVMDKPSKIDTPDALYAKAQKIDGWPSPHEGTTVRAAMAVMRAEGRLGRYVWAQTEEELWYWVMSQGPAVIGVAWRECMMETYGNGMLRVDRKSPEVGGHAVYIYGGSVRLDCYRLQNSWGPEWGDKGRFWVRRRDMALLLEGNGEACGALEVKVA
jgi:hypothetical protein